ncbi:uncharacterized protein LOC132700367 [Cylas formicarius]|uniref:uncharacterized protein LOC132700367 n=1 Tax=Cylas formicarius TaxID=197179 RepID=UPI0029586737|nr:uncharacterized protein LOC132700367 [Cylas formicarius]
MKYNTIGSSSLGTEGRKPTFTIYANMDISQNKIAYTESEMKAVREDLKKAQNCLHIQTKMCRQLVAEYTRKLQDKERLFQTEKALRDTQLAKVLKALLIFEARLKQEQKFISHQLSEKDYIIKTQRNDIKTLLQSQYCKNCNQYYTPSPALESLDSSSEYVAIEHDYQSSAFESLDSSSETYATLSDRGYNKNILDDKKYTKNKKNNPLHPYFEVQKVRNESPLSNEDNTSADYDNLDSLPPESISDKISIVSENIESILSKNASTDSESSFNLSSSECDKTVINARFDEKETPRLEHNQSNDKTGETPANEEKKLTETIPVFEGGGDGNENWYASASDQEDEEQRDVYRNNPVLECVNQILLQNINDSLSSPPKTPNIERKSVKNNKRVKFSDEEEKILTEENIKNSQHSHNYYETPIQKPPNYYETPQSIYSNDYEQIMSQCSDSFSEQVHQEQLGNVSLDTKISHYYVELEGQCEKDRQEDKAIVRKAKILRTPPALPPKPANLVSKYKIQHLPKKLPAEKNTAFEYEPDYCSISELNLPQKKNISVKKISVVAEINAPTSLDVMAKINAPSPVGKKVDLANFNDSPSLVVKKCVQKFNIQVAKQSPVKKETGTAPKVIQKKQDTEIPKLPQVSEIIIPDESEDQKSEERISQDNYVKNNTQILKSKARESRKPILMGTSISNLISGLNSHQILSDIKKKPGKIDKKMFASFENVQNLDKHFSTLPDTPDTPKFENFDLSQNFEEFKLDDCEIEEYNVEEGLNEKETEELKSVEGQVTSKRVTSGPNNDASTRVKLVRATPDNLVPPLNMSSVEELKKQLEIHRGQALPVAKQKTKGYNSEPTYEHFLECTGLSSKSILTPTRMLSNHKSVLKPKDVKLRSRVKANNIFERYSGTTVKYWSEPFV